MPQAVPSYRRHKQSGLAVVTLRLPSGKRKDYVLGDYGSRESKAEYARLIGEFQTGHGIVAGQSGTGEDLTVNELLVRYMAHCRAYYRDAEGNPTGQAEGTKFALRHLKALYGHTLARDFGPLALKSVRSRMITSGNSRTTVNQRAGIVRQFFKWCVAEQLIPPSVMEGLRAVPGLQPGRTEAAERKPVRPADVDQVAAAVPFMPATVAALVQLQLHCGARGGELLGLEAKDIDRSGPVWSYRPPQHKNAWRSRAREIFFGPKAQSVLNEWIEKNPTGPLFSPAASEDEGTALAPQRRQSPRFPGDKPRGPARLRKLRRRAPRDRYTSCSYRRAIERACARAFPLPVHLRRKFVKVRGEVGRKETRDEWAKRIGPAGVTEAQAWRKACTWTPHRLRHTAGTAIRKEHGIEMARVILGHSSAFTTEVYAEVDRQQARDVVAKMG